MGERRGVRFFLIAVALASGIFWAAASAQQAPGDRYPNARYLVTGEWLQANRDTAGTVVVDVRTDEHFDGRVIPGAVRMPWSRFREDDPARGVGSAFVGTVRAQ